MPQTFTAYRAGGRSRTVQNIAGDPGTKAYTITEATSPPSADTDGFKNIGLQKTLHCLVKTTQQAETLVFRSGDITQLLMNGVS